MISATALPWPAVAASMAVGGFGLGLGYLAALHRTVSSLTRGGGWVQPAALTLGRILAATAVFTAAALTGAMGLLMLLAGFLLAQALVLYRARRSR